MYFADNRGSLAESQNYTDPIQEEGLDEGVEPYEGEGVVDSDALLEEFIVDLVCRMNEDARNEYLQSEEFQTLVEAGAVGRKAIVRMSRQADLERRINLVSIQKAKEKGDADWEALRKNRVNERRLLNRIYQKYGRAVRQDAVASQKRLLKISPQAFNMMKAIR